MKKLLFFLLLISTSVFADETVYTGANYNSSDCSAIATAIGRAASVVSIDVRPSDKWIKVIIANMTAQEITDLDSLMVTTNGLTKQ